MISRPAPSRALVPFRNAFRYWFRLGFINFGGPAGQIAIMHDELVEEKRWISNGRFLHALNFCMLLPGPEAQQLAIYIGWLLNGTMGGIVAGVLFVLPAFVLMMVLSWTYAVHGNVDWVAAIFYGLSAGVIAIVASAVIRIGSKALKSRVHAAVAVGAFVAIFFLKIPFPFVIIAAALIGLAGSRIRPEIFVGGQPETEEDESIVLGDAKDEEADGHSTGRTVRVITVGLLVWWVPLLLVALVRGTDDTLTKEAFFFSQTAMITFGGAYAVLAYINQMAVGHFGWLAPGQMVTGLGLAESTPGPLIMVTQFVGFLAGYNFPGGLDPVVGGILGATVAVWATFAPCFLWIFVGAPYIERLRGNEPLAGALSAITAAVVGVIANLAVLFAIVTLFDEVSDGSLGFVTFPLPRWASIDWFAAAVTAVAFVGMWRWRWKVLPVVTGCAAAGLVYRAVT